MLLRVTDRLPNDLLMPQVHSVEESDRQTNVPSVALQFACRRNDFHWMQDSQPAARLRKGITRFSSSLLVRSSRSSSMMACATSNFPEVTRRRLVRCAPHPTFCPKS